MNISEAIVYAKKHKMDSFEARELISYFVKEDEKFVITHMNDYDLNSNEVILFTNFMDISFMLMKMY